MLPDLFVRVGTETTHGTAASTFVAVPVEKFQTELKENVDYPDEARAQREEAYVAIRGSVLQESSIGGRIYHDVMEPILRALFGPPTIVANPDGTRTLTFVAQTDPASLTLQWFDKVQARQSVYNVLDEWNVMFGGDEQLKWDAKMMGKGETDIATPAPAFTSALPFTHWQAAVQIAGVTSTDLVSYKLMYKRNREAFYTARGGATPDRSPHSFTEGKRGGSLDLTLDFPTQAEYLQAKNLAQLAVAVTFTDNDIVIGTGTRKPSIKFEVPKAVWSTKSVDVGGNRPLLKIKSDKLLAGANGSVIVTLETV